MSDDNRENTRRGKDRSRTTSDESYDVGYGKPPKHTQFTKGISGNPRGRPKKRSKRPIRFSDAMSERFLEEEAYRSVTLRENGQPIELPVVQAIMRSLVTEGIKGKRLHQKYAIDMIMEFENLKHQAKVDRYVRLQDLKRAGEQQIERHTRKNLPPPDLLPHPDDIVLDPVSGDAYVNGPMTRDDLKYYEQSVELRDHLLLRSAHAKRIRKTPLIHHDNEGGCYFMVLAQLLDHFLPARYRWKEMDAISLMMEFGSMPKRARERLIESETARLEAERVPLRGMNPEVAEILRRVRRRFLGNAA